MVSCGDSWALLTATAPVIMFNHAITTPLISMTPVILITGTITRKPCYCKDDRAMCPTYKLFTLILFTLTATILCADFDSERI